MNINYLRNVTFSFFKDTITNSLLAHKNKILTVASIIFAGLTIYAIGRRIINAKLLSKQKNEKLIQKDGKVLERDKLEKELDLAQQIDCEAPLNGWKRGLGKNEKEQTFELFKVAPESQVNAHRKALKIVIFEQISPRDLEIIAIVKDYLSVVHGLETSIEPNPLKLYQVQTRQKPGSKDPADKQYPIESHLQLLKLKYPHDFALGFTDKDLYPYLEADQVNFIFGVGRIKTATGLFSTNRFSIDPFTLALKRLMKIASHEFAHMRGIGHCTKYICNMQGNNGLAEMDEVPLTFCAHDMAKICYVNHTSLKQEYQKHLSFFENFFAKYGKKVDFTFEIEHLKKKIAKLETFGE